MPAPYPPTVVRAYYSDRRSALYKLPFLEVRNLALSYQGAHGKQLMSYNESLGPRHMVYEAILQHELVTGLILPDYLRPPTLEPPTDAPVNKETEEWIRQAISHSIQNLRATILNDIKTDTLGWLSDAQVQAIKKAIYDEMREAINAQVRLHMGAPDTKLQVESILSGLLNQFLRSPNAAHLITQTVISAVNARWDSMISQKERIAAARKPKAKKGKKA